MAKELLQEALAELESAVIGKCGGEVREIDEAVSKVASLKDPASIKALLCFLRDSALYDEGMYSLIHAAESFDDDIYIREFLFALPTLCRQAPAWASVVLMRVLNSDSARESLTKQVPDKDQDVKDSLIWLLEQINRESTAFLTKTVAPLVAAKG